MKKHMLSVACVLIAFCLLTACQPTPEVPVVVGKDQETLKAAMAQTEAAAETAQPYDAPEHIKLDIDDLPNNFSIVFDADVEVSGQTAWPVYTIEKAAVTQEQADAVRKALLKDTVLYKPGEYRSREEIQRRISGYEKELKDALEEGYAELVESYQGFLKDLYAEYENTPEDLKLEEADTHFAFMEERLMPQFYGGKETETEDGGFRYEWTVEARANAKAAGCESIYGVCWLDNGRKMQFSANNGDYFWGIGYRIDDGNVMTERGVSYSIEEAESQADALLKEMGFDFVMVNAWTMPETSFDEEKVTIIGDRFHVLMYKPRIEGVPQDDIISCIDQNLGDDYKSPIPTQETISIMMDDYGVNCFNWSRPMQVVEQESANVALMPFDDIRMRIAQQLEVQTLWSEEADSYEADDIVSRRLEVNKLKLSYLPIEKQNDLDSYYLMPVWNVCADMYYKYRDDYPTGESNTYILDDNNERNAWAGEIYHTRDGSMMTINAVDGSVIPRHSGR